MKRLFVFAFLSFLILGVCFAQEKLTLDQSVQIALEQSPVMLKARAEIAAAEGAAGQAVASFLPQLSVSGSTGRYYSEPTTMQITMAGSSAAYTFGTDEQAETIKYSASLTQAIFAGGRILNSIGMANKGLVVAREELRKVAQSVTFNVVQAYYGTLKAQKYADLSSQSVEMARNHLARVKVLANVGMSTRADVLRTEVQLAKVELGWTKAKQAYEIAKSSFNNVLGKDLDSPVGLAEFEFEVEDVVVYAYADLLKIAYQERPDWQQYLLVKGVSEDEMRIAYSGLLPSISLIGNIERGSTTYSSYQANSYNWTAMLSGSWNLFDGAATLQKIKESRAKLKAQEADEMSVKKGLA